MNQDFAILKRIYNAFDPFRPLPAGDPAYVNCEEVRGDGDVFTTLGRDILFSDKVTCQLYAGHRGAGKSTELLRLKAYLEEQGCCVVYFAADEADIDPQDTQYTDILLACTRHLLRELKSVDSSPLLNWLRDRWQALQDLGQTEIAFDKLTVDAKISEFAKLTANIRAVPTERQKIRDKLNPHTVTLIKALNDFIAQAKQQLNLNDSQLIIIADNLDRITPTLQEDGRTNHDHIFLDRSEQLGALNCHLIYTVPISMVYSDRATVLEDRYGTVQVLPMVTVKRRNGDIYPAGMDKLKEMIALRMGSDLSLEQVFQNSEALTELCLWSGGHVRNLMLLVKTAVRRTNQLPISEQAVLRAIAELRETYRKTINDDEWEKLARVYLDKRMPNNDDYRKLLFNRCILEYQYLDPSSLDKPDIWQDIHPLIFDLDEFQNALNQASASETSHEPSSYQ